MEYRRFHWSQSGKMKILIILKSKNKFWIISGPSTPVHSTELIRCARSCQEMEGNAYKCIFNNYSDLFPYNCY